MNKTSLSCFDDERYVLDDGIRTLGYCHKDRKIVMIEKGRDN